MKQHQPNSFISRAAAMLLTVIMAFAGAQTAGAQKPCVVTFDISGEGTVEFGGGSVTNYGSSIQVDRDLTSNAMFEMALLPDEGYYVSSATYQLFKYNYDNSFTLITSGDLSNDEGNNWSFVINEYPYDNSNSFPLIVVHIVFSQCKKITFDISGEGTVELQGEEQWLEVTNGQTIDCSIPYDRDLTITPETGYVVSSVTYDATDGLSIDLNQDDDFQWSLHIDSYEGSETPTITVHIVFGLAGGADEASAVALTADNDLSHLIGGWYKVESDLALGHTVNLHGDTHIIIASGKTLTVNTSDEYGISGSALTVSGEGTLAVSANRAIYVDNYTQMGCAVTLSGDTDGLTAENNVSISGGSLTTSGAIIGIDTNNGSITISGGTVSSSGDSAGLFAGGDVSITGGTVSASGNNYGIRGYSVSITGGQVTASSGGIYSTYCDITLGWTSATDYITASGYVLQNDGYHVKIADGQTLYGGFPSASFTGTIGDPSALNGKTLRPSAAVTESGTNEYTILSAAGWDAFCDRLAADDGKAFFSGKTVKLGADITVSRMAGASQHDFMGKFDGQEHTLTFNYNTGTDDAAPFRYVEDGCVIENLRVCGTIETSAKFAAGLVAHQYGNVTIRNCRSSVTIKSSVSSGNGDGTHGGFVAQNHNAGDITFEGCLFDGKLLTTGSTATTRCGGFVGWRSNNEGAVIKVKNSLYAPAALEVGEIWISTTESATFVRDGIASDITNSYYTSDFNDGSSFTGQGKQLRSIAAGEGVTLGHAGVATEYSVSGITAYKASEASGDDDPFIAGIIYNNVLYAGSGDAVSLTLGNSATPAADAPAGYQYSGDYSATGGATLSGSTLTMADDNVTVSFTPGELRSTHQAVLVSYIDADGQPASHNAIALDGTEGSLGQGGQETWYFVGADISYGDEIDCYGIVNIILCDGKTMTVSSGSYGIYGSNGALIIYGQTLGTGILNATCTNYGIFYYSGSVVIRGGTVNATSTNSAGIYADSSVLITGGTVNATVNNNDGIYAYSSVIITGGKVTATGSEYSVGINAERDITITGGQVTATSTNGNGINADRDITITGGQVNATSTNGNGIFAGGDITLGWTSASDFIKASSYYLDNSNRTVSIASGQSLYNGSEVLGSGTVDDYASKLDGKTLVPYIESTTDDGTAILYDNDAGLPDGHRNADRIATLAADGTAHDIMLMGRTLYKDGGWNTLCLPFTIDDIQADGCPLNGATVRQLSKAYVTGTTLTLNFSDPTTTMAAGTPYIVKWDGGTEGEYTQDPVFQDVTLSTDTHDYDTQPLTTPGSATYDPDFTTDARVRFIGTYDQKTIDTEDKSILFLGAGNKLYYPDGTGSGVTIGAFRAYFKIGDGEALARQLTAFNIDFGDETGIGHTEITEITEKAGAWYTLDGVRLDGKPTKRSAEGRLLPTGRKKGLYIHGGKKVVVP
jgi:hypothetical protein